MGYKHMKYIFNFFLEEMYVMGKKYNSPISLVMTLLALSVSTQNMTNSSH